MRRNDQGQWELDLWMARWYPEFGRSAREWTFYEWVRFLGSVMLVGNGIGTLYWLPHATALYGPAVVSILVGMLWMWWPRPERSGE